MKNYPLCLDCKIKLKDYRSKRCNLCSSNFKNKDKRPSLNCLNCNKVFITTNHKAKKRKCCSVQCGLDYYFKYHKGENHPNWKGQTHSNKLLRLRFYHYFRKLVLKRDDYKCVLCGSSDRLQVDHIQSWAEYIELRFSIDNCRTLCIECHYKITYNKPMSTKTWGGSKPQEDKIYA